MKNKSINITDAGRLSASSTAGHTFRCLANHFAALLALLYIFTPGTLLAADYFVSPKGSDSNPGNHQLPFRTIQHAADVMQPGDVCLVGGGIYRETVEIKKSGRQDAPIRFAAAPGERVVFDGTELVNSPWEKYKGPIYKTTLHTPVRQLFVGRQMMIEARWPNVRFDQLLDRAGWAKSNEGSRYGMVVSDELAKTGIDWTGATIVLNGPFYSWARPVTSYDKQRNAISYQKNLEGIEDTVGNARVWESDYYYLTGTLAALDAPTEWFYDQASGTLYFYADEGRDPNGEKVSYKQRDYAFVSNGNSFIQLEGFEYFATTVQLHNCTSCLISKSRFIFPTYSNNANEISGTEVSGTGNIVRDSIFANASGSALRVSGVGNTIDDIIVRNTSWYGSLKHPAVDIAGQAGQAGNTISHSTLYHSGGVLVRFIKGPDVVEYNQIYDGGRLSKDVSLVYSGWPETAGSVVRYNWIHGVRPGGREGMCIRGDTQTRELTIHHNVIWDCGRDGIIVKGDSNNVYNNTVFDVGSPDDPGNYISMHQEAELSRPWMRQAVSPLSSQNEHSKVFNNAARTLTRDIHGSPLSPSTAMANNYSGANLGLTDPAKLDFRPIPGSPLIDAGRQIQGLPHDFAGRAPDIGAYEYGAPPWIPGAKDELIQIDKTGQVISGP